jgi:hypothetical protein
VYLFLIGPQWGGQAGCMCSAARPLARPFYEAQTRARRFDLVRAEGLEPPRFAPPESKSGASTNSATPAHGEPSHILETGSISARITSCTAKLRPCADRARRCYCPLRGGRAISAGRVRTVKNAHYLRLWPALAYAAGRAVSAGVSSQRSGDRHSRESRSSRSKTNSLGNRSKNLSNSSSCERASAVAASRLTDIIS